VERKPASAEFGFDGASAGLPQNGVTKIMRSLPVFFLLPIISLSACGTLPNGRGWGEEATLSPGWQRISDAAMESVTDISVWVPAAIALLFQFNNVDEDISEWAVDHNPIFGSVQNADDASDHLRGAAMASYLTTAMMTPSGYLKKDWAEGKMKGLGVGLSALAATAATTETLKRLTNRTRPDGSDQESFPSGHSSIAAASASLAAKNTENLNVPGWGKNFLKAGFFTLSVATGWARVEAEKHYPSDVLFGMALGNFIGTFFNDAFMGLVSPGHLTIAIGPTAKGASMRLHYRFY
jgi:membrane-associated phospholipid phosphatase